MPPDNTQPTEADLWKEVAQERAGESNEALGEGQPRNEIPEAAPAQTQAPAIDPVDLRIQELLASQQQLQQTILDYGNQLKRAEGRIGALQSEMAQRQQAAAAQAAAATSQPSASQVAAAINEPEKWKTLKKDFPDWGEAIEEFIKANRQAPAAAAEAVPTKVEPQPQQLNVDALRQQVKAEIETETRNGEYQRVEMTHPGWQSTVKTPIFMDWYAKQPDEVKALSSSPYANDAISLLTAFKRAVSSPSNVQQTREQVLNAAMSRPGGAAPRGASVSDAPKSLEQIWKEEAEARRARAGAL